MYVTAHVSIELWFCVTKLGERIKMSSFIEHKLHYVAAFWQTEQKIDALCNFGGVPNEQ